MTVLSKLLHDIRPESNFTTSEDFLADGLLDSFDMVLLIASLDKEFGISIDGLDIVPENFRNLQAIELLLSKYKVKK